MPTLTRRDRYSAITSGMRRERTSFEAHWREIADFLFPMRPRFQVTDRNRGDRRNQKIIDSTATYASNTLRAGMHAGLTSPARPWMKLLTPDPDLNKFGPVQEWLYTMSMRMLMVFQLTNLYKVLPSVYGDMGVFGTSAVAVLDDPGDVGRPGDLFRCQKYPIGSYWIDLDNRGLATSFFREYTRTIAQLVEEFGGKDGQPLEPKQEPDWSRFSRGVKDLWDRSDYNATVEICWLVTPNRDYVKDAIGPRGFAWSSCYYEKGGPEGGEPDFLRESGYHEFPVLVPTWEREAEDIYGTDCPGMTALGDTKQLQTAQKKKAQAIEKQLNPPQQAPHSVRTQKVSLLPGDVTYVDDTERGVRPIHEIKPDLQHMVLDIQEVQHRINKAFHVDLFRMIDNMNLRRGAQPPTAREIEEAHEEKLIQLGPVLQSTDDELLDPLVDRVFAMMARAKLIPPPPPELEGVDLMVEYTSIMYQAQKMIGVANQDRFMLTLTNLAEVFPSVRHKVKPHKAVDIYADILGVDPDQVRSDDEAEALEQGEMQAAQQQMQAESAAKLGQAAHALGSTPMQGDTALNRILEGVTG